MIFAVLKFQFASNTYILNLLVFLNFFYYIPSHRLNVNVQLNIISFFDFRRVLYVTECSLKICINGCLSFYYYSRNIFFLILCIWAVYATCTFLHFEAFLRFLALFNLHVGILHDAISKKIKVCRPVVAHKMQHVKCKTIVKMHDQTARRENAWRGRNDE